MRELAIFEKFAVEAGLKVVPGSLSKCEPPQPDIICSLEGEGQVRFELAEACAFEFAEAINNPRPEGVYSCFGTDVSEDTLRKKLSKSYPVSEPIELLLYTDGATAKPDYVLKLEFEAILSETQGPYRRVWLHGDKTHEIWTQIC